MNLIHIDLVSFCHCAHSQSPTQSLARIPRGRCGYFRSIGRRCEGWSMILCQTAAPRSVAWPIDLCYRCPIASRLRLSSIGLRSPSRLHGRPRSSSPTAVFGRPQSVWCRKRRIATVAYRLDLRSWIAHVWWSSWQFRQGTPRSVTSQRTFLWRQ